MLTQSQVQATLRRPSLPNGVAVEVRRERPVLRRTPDGLVSGVLDRAVYCVAVWVARAELLDYKTRVVARETVAAVRESYRPQISEYQGTAGIVEAFPRCRQHCSAVRGRCGA